MGISPWYLGDLAPAWAITLDTDSGTANLTGVSAGSLSMLFKNINAGTSTTGTGTFTITQNNPAIVQYQLASTDVTVAGMYDVYLVVTFANGNQTFLVARNWLVGSAS